MENQNKSLHMEKPSRIVNCKSRPSIMSDQNFDTDGQMLPDGYMVK